MRFCADIDMHELYDLLRSFSLKLQMVNGDKTIPGSYWGDPEAGLLKHTLYYRDDTPVHSLLHEACHFICMNSERRNKLDTNAGGSHIEECAVCYLQILLSDHCASLDRISIMQDMDAWGYSFRLSSTHAWFEQDAEDAIAWLTDKRLITPHPEYTYQPAWQLRL